MTPLACLLALLVGVPAAGPGHFSAEDSLGWSFGQRYLMRGFGASVELEDGGWGVDSSHFEARAELRLSRGATGIDAVVAAIREDSVGRLALREGRAAVRWPGTPWIGGRAFFGTDAPFIEGLRRPLIGFEFVEPDSLRGVGISCGGILGFEMQGTFTEADSGSAWGDGTDLRMLTIDAPWLGFGTFRYDRLELPDDRMQLTVLSAMLDARYVRPHVVWFDDGLLDRSWGLMAEIRGIRLFHGRSGDLVAVPSFYHAADSTRDVLVPAFPYGVGSCGALDLHFTSRRSYLSGSVGGWLDLGSPDRFGLRGRFDMLSESGFRYGAEGGYVEPSADYWMTLGGGYARRGAEAGMSVTIHPDSVRMQGEARYSPRRDVSLALMVSGDLESDIDPAGSVVASVWLDRAAAVLALDWLDGETGATLGVTGWF